MRKFVIEYEEGDHDWEDLEEGIVDAIDSVMDPEGNGGIFWHGSSGPAEDDEARERRADEAFNKQLNRDSAVVVAGIFSVTILSAWLMYLIWS